MVEVIDISGKKQNIDCIACSIQSKKIKLPVERIAESKHFVVEQDFEWPIEGFLIIASKRHIHSIEEFNKNEEKEFIKILKRSREIMTQTIAISKVTIVQEEDSSTSHFHVWLFPWHSWMKDIGSKLKDIKDIMKYSKENFSTKKNLEQIKKTSKIMKSKF